MRSSRRSVFALLITVLAANVHSAPIGSGTAVTTPSPATPDLRQPDCTRPNQDPRCQPARPPSYPPNQYPPNQYPPNQYPAKPPYGYRRPVIINQVPATPAIDIHALKDDWEGCRSAKLGAIRARNQGDPGQANDLDDWLWKNCRYYSDELRQLEQDDM